MAEHILAGSRQRNQTDSEKGATPSLSSKEFAGPRRQANAALTQKQELGRAEGRSPVSDAAIEVEAIEASRTAILILGMHRSGTSALTRLVSMLGASLPRRLLGGREGNETGHWEPECLIAYHDKMLADFDSAWYDWVPLDLKRVDERDLKRIRNDIAKLIEEDYGDSPLIVLKEPRIARFAQFFAEILGDAGYEIKVVVAYRNPIEVIESLLRRTSVWPDGHDRLDAAMLWLAHMLEAEQAARAFSHAVVSYDSVMANPVLAIQAVVDRLGVQAPQKAIDIADAASDFITERQRHHTRKAEEVVLDPQLAGWVAETYGALCDLEADRNVLAAHEILDRVRNEFVSSMPILKAVADGRRSADARARNLQKQLELSKAEWENSAAEYWQRIADAEAREVALQTAIEGARTEHAIVSEAHKSALEELTDGIAAREAILTTLRAEIAEAFDRERAIESRLQQAQAELGEMHEARDEVVQLRADLDRKIVEAGRAGVKTKALKAQLKDARREVRGLQDSVTSSKLAHADVSEALVEQRRQYDIFVEETIRLSQKATNQLAEREADIELQQRHIEKIMAAHSDAESRLGEALQHVQNLEASLVERNLEQRVLKSMLDDAHRAYSASTSWKLTAPIRGVGRILAGAKEAISLAPSAIKVGGGVFPSLSKAARILSTEGSEGVRGRLDVVRRNHRAHASEFVGLVDAPLVSVIVPNYNHAAFLQQRLETIYSQDYPNFEVILLDDFSSDDSRAHLEAYARRYPDITRYIPNETNSGSGYRQWAKGLSLARGQLVWIAESDDWSDTSFLSRLVPLFADEALSVAYVNSSFVSADGSREIWTTDAYLADIDDKLWKQSFCLTGHQLAGIGWKLKNLIPNVSSAVFRHPGKDSALLRGEWTNMRICGDWLLYLNLIKGARVAYLPEKLNYYRIHEGSTAKSTFTKDVYYSEHASVASSVIENFDVSQSFLEHQEGNLRTHWAQNRLDFTEARFRKCYDPKRIRKATRSRKPNLLMCGYAFAAGGGETLPIFLANLFKEIGYSVTFLSFEQEPREEGVRLLLRPDIPIVCDFRNIGSIINDFGIDVVHSHHAWVDNTILDLIGTDSRAATVISTHGMYEGLSAADQDRIVPRIERMCSAIVYTAEKNLEPFVRLELADSPKLARIPNALPEVPVSPVDLRELGIPKSAFVLCLVSRAIPEKGWEEAIEAVELARRKSGRDIHLILIGEGKEYDRLKPLSTQKWLHFLGFKKNIRDYLASSHMGLLPSRFRGESFPLTLIDCLAVGRPFLGSAIGEIPKMLEADSQLAGSLFELENWTIPVVKLADLIAEFASNKKYYEEKAVAAKQAYKKFDPAKMIGDYAEVYEAAMLRRTNQ